ncbi:hypothetical protein DYE50_01170 [Treponema ruminis]|nr:hypothetical protein DYE50_01170 [Treponema ruminis]
MLSLLVTSCNNFGEESSNEEKNTVSVPTIVVSVVDEKARTAFPEMDTSKITEYHLTGTRSTSGAVINSIDKTWAKDGTTSAYEKMTSDSLAISAGEWNFTLTGKVKEGEVELASYEGTLTKTIGSGENSLQFKLLLQDVNVGTGAGTGTLEIAIELKDAASTQVQAITGTLLKSSDRSSAGFPIASYNVTNSTPTYTYSVSSVPAGVYIAQIDFYGDTNKEALLGTWLEAVNINSLGAKASISISDVDSIYSITYTAGVLGESSILGGSSLTSNPNPTQFTRRNEVSLTAPTMTGYKFIKWVDISSDSTSVTGDAFINTSAITGIPKKTVGNKTFCAVFIKDEDAADITEVAITGLDEGGKAKVGSTITATAKTSDGNFAGAVSKWIWYYVDGSAEKEITTVSTGCTATSTYTVEPKYYGKKIKARVVPKYDARNLSSGSVVLNNSASDYVHTDSEEKEISQGTLDAGDVVLKYTETPVRGTELENHFAIKTGTLKDSTVGTWTLPNGENYKVTVTYNDTKDAPDVSSGEVSSISVKFDVTVKDVGGTFVDAYETLSTTKNVFVNVQYEANTSNLATSPALDKANDYAITYRKLKFTSSSTSLTSKGQSATMQYRFGTSGTWNDISDSEFDGFTAGQDIVIQLRYKATGMADTAGYIKESDAFDLETITWTEASNKDNTTSGLGKKIVLDKVEISGNANVCGTLTATAKPTFTNSEGIDFTADGYGTITWNWYAGDSEITSAREESTHSKTSSLTINEDLRTTCYNKTIKAEAVYTYSKVTPAATITKSATSSSIGAGGVISSSGISLTYTEGKVLADTVLDGSKVSATGSFVNALNETVTIADKNPSFNFDGATAPSSSGNVNVKVTVNGYDTMTVPVKIDVKAAAPSIGGGGEGGGGGSGSSAANTLLKEDVEYIPYGHIKFDDTFTDRSINDGFGPSLAFYEYTADGSEAEHWYPIIPQNDKPDSLGEYVRNKGDGRLFAPNGGSEQTIRIRYRKRAFKTGGTGIGFYAFYDVNKNLWVSHVGEKIGDGYTTDEALLESGLGYSGITEASDSIPVYLTDHVGKYSGKITDITVNNDSELKLTVSGKTVTASREAGLTGFTYQWYLDGEIVSNATANSFTLPDTYRLHDKYVIRLEAKDGNGQIYTATATVTVGN